MLKAMQPAPAGKQGDAPPPPPEGGEAAIDPALLTALLSGMTACGQLLE